MSATNQAQWHQHYHMMNVIIPTCFMYMTLLVIIQIIAVKWYNKKYNTNTMELKSMNTFCVFGLYFTQILCSIQCFLCHISHVFDEIFCLIGTPICTIIYGAARCFLYGVWLERAKIIQKGYISFMPPIIMEKLVPFYIAFYYALLLILIAIFFRGKLVLDINGEVTSCHFDEWVYWVPILATFADGFNAILFLFLFIYPLYRNMKNCVIQEPSKKKKFIKLIKLNIIFTAICSISSMSTIVIIADPQYLVPLFMEYIWLITNIDIVINGTSVFLLFAPNREFIKHLFKKIKKLCIPQKQTKMMSNIEKVLSNDDNQDKQKNIEIVSSTQNPAESTKEIYSSPYKSNIERKPLQIS